MTNYQFEIKFRDNKTLKDHILYANRSQVGCETYAKQCMNNKLDWLKNRAKNFNRDITILSTVLNKV